MPEVLVDGVRYVPEPEATPGVEPLFWIAEQFAYDGRWFPVGFDLRRPPVQPALTDDDIVVAAKRHGVPAAHLDAVRQVEAAGSGFLLKESPPARPKILFERHWFYRLTPVRVSASRPDLSSTSPGGYKGGSAEWDRLRDACAFDFSNALKSASWGMGQVMGFNFEIAGCQSIEDFVLEAFTGEPAQFQHMLNFIEGNHLMDELRRGDWRGFAKGYNGPAYEKNSYHTKLAAAAAKSTLS